MKYRIVKLNQYYKQYFFLFNIFVIFLQINKNKKLIDIE